MFLAVGAGGGIFVAVGTGGKMFLVAVTSGDMFISVGTGDKMFLAAGKMISLSGGAGYAVVPKQRCWLCCVADYTDSSADYRYAVVAVYICCDAGLMQWFLSGSCVGYAVIWL